MLEVKVSDLRNHLPEYIGRAESGEEILVTRRGRVVARLTNVRDVRASAKERLAALRDKAHVGNVVSPLDGDWEASM